jgi:hypothetical protein
MGTNHRNDARTSVSEQAARVAALTDKLHASVSELTSSAAWTRMLGAVAKFHRYSARNILLLLIQAEERGTQITHVAGYRTWQTLGRQVRRGEKRYEVLAPIRHRLSSDEAAERAAVGLPAYDAEGRPIRVVCGFRIEHVFDISQTDGEQFVTMPKVPYLVGDGPAGLWDAIAELITEAGFAISRQTLAGGVRGETNYTNRIVTVGNELPPAEAIYGVS